MQARSEPRENRSEIESQCRSRNSDEFRSKTIVVAHDFRKPLRNYPLARSGSRQTSENAAREKIKAEASRSAVVGILANSATNLLR
jgi:hypothetical protein